MKRSDLILFKALGYSKKRKTENSLSDGCLELPLEPTPVTSPAASPNSPEKLQKDLAPVQSSLTPLAAQHTSPENLKLPLPSTPLLTAPSKNPENVDLHIPFAQSPLVPVKIPEKLKLNLPPPARSSLIPLAAPHKSPENLELTLPPAQLLRAPPKIPENVELHLPPAKSPLTLLAVPHKIPENLELSLPHAQLLTVPPENPENLESPLGPLQLSLDPLEGSRNGTENECDSPMAPLTAVVARLKTTHNVYDSPEMLTNLPFTLLANSPKNPENVESPLPPAQSSFNPLDGRPNGTEYEYDSPMAPTYSPLTPVVTRLKTTHNVYDSPDMLTNLPFTLLATSPNNPDNVESPLPPAQSSFNPLDGPPNSTEYEYDSPMAPTYSPLTPVVTRLKTTHNVYDSPDMPTNLSFTLLATLPKSSDSIRSENSSPLRTMSPSTLEMFNSLSVDSAFKIGKTNEDNVMEDIVVERTKKSVKSTKNDEQDEITGFSSDTDSDYIPDTDESEDDAVLRPKPRTMIIAAMVHSSNSGSVNDKDEVNKEGHSLLNENIIVQQPIVDDRIDQIDLHERESEAENGLNSNPAAETECLNLKGRPKKGRKRKFSDYTLAERKQRKYANLSYHGKSKQVVPKTFKDYTCTCTRQCHNLVSAEKRENEFLHYIALGSYEAQLLYIINHVSESEKKRAYTVLKGSKTVKKRPRNFTRVYKICDTQVCRDMFVETYQITPKKIDICLKKYRSGDPINDKRGKAGGWNKKEQKDIDFIKNIINSLPKYESHYRRETTDFKYLKVGMTIDKIYQIYVDQLKKEHGEAITPVSNAYFKREFYKNFYLRCKALKKDTCNKCDAFVARIRNVVSEEEKTKLDTEREVHLKRAKSLRQNMNDDLKRAKTDETFECLTYDLEKTLPLPRIPTNIVFYKRQLWLYNCVIHAGSSDIGHCYVWVEGDAGRGSQEVGSCLFHFIKNKLSPKVHHLVLWSDCCGGQNRNIKMVLMLKAVLNSHDTLKSIKLKYLESGHTFLPNDTDFSKIETQLKNHERIYTADEYIKVMKNCKKKNPLQVYKMKRNDFFSVNAIEKKIVNRKIDVKKKKVSWLSTKEILLKKEDEHSFYMKRADCEELQEVNFQKKMRGIIHCISENDFNLLWPNGKEIAQAKLDDLKSMFDLIPKDCLDFYQRLLPLGNARIVEDVDGFNSLSLDFEVETDNGQD